ncbi:MAG: restriction endonuclease [Chthoniobacter sp.]|nr:restriction endonuclease [Chthoniobacter sp.]
MPISETLVLPTEIPWESIKGHALEECVFWLLEALGAKQIDWRVGGSGKGTADGGRDLECIFNIPQPSGEMLPQIWWVEAKGRGTTVSPSDVKESILTVSGKADVDVHLIVTNQQFSNPTKDWINAWKAAHRRPDIRIWEKHDLERLVSRNPIVAVRLFPKALTPEGKCEVMTTKFWDYMSFTDVPTLKLLWRARSGIAWSNRSLFAALARECATGDLAKRPWGSVIPLDRLAVIYLEALVNAFYLMFRADAAGVRFDPVLDALAHLLTHLIARFEPMAVARLTEGSFDTSENLSALPQEVRRAIIDPIVARVFHQAADACLGDCKRVSGGRNEANRDEPSGFWQRFRSPMEEEEEDKGADSSQDFYIEWGSGPCAAGLPLSGDYGCPMIHFDNGRPLSETFESIRPVIINRSGLKPHVEDSED